MTIKKFEEALQAFKNAAEVYENNREQVALAQYSDARLYIAKCLAEMNRQEEALSLCEDIIQEQSNHKETWSFQGTLYGKLENYRKAVECFDEAIKIHENYLDAWINKAYTLSKMGNHREAILVYEKALSINSSDCEVMYFYAQSLKKVEKHEEALLLYKNLVLEEPHNYRFHLEKGHIELALGIGEAAISSYEIAININKHMNQAWRGKGQVLLELKRYPEAIASFDKAISSPKTLHMFSDDIPASFYGKALCYAALEDIANTISSLEKAFDEDILEREISLYRYKIEMDEDQFSKISSTDEFQDFLEKYPI